MEDMDLFVFPMMDTEFIFKSVLKALEVTKACGSFPVECVSAALGTAEILFGYQVLPTSSWHEYWSPTGHIPVHQSLLRKGSLAVTHRPLDCLHKQYPQVREGFPLILQAWPVVSGGPLSLVSVPVSHRNLILIFSLSHKFAI